MDMWYRIPFFFFSFQVRDLYPYNINLNYDVNMSHVFRFISSKAKTITKTYLIFYLNCLVWTLMLLLVSAHIKECTHLMVEWRKYFSSSLKTLKFGKCTREGGQERWASDLLHTVLVYLLYLLWCTILSNTSDKCIDTVSLEPLRDFNTLKEWSEMSWFQHFLLLLS